MNRAMRAADGRVVAVLDGQTLIKKVVAAQHMLRKPPSWAFDAATIEDALSGNATSIEVWATDEGKVYTSTMPNFLTYSFALDRGHSPQLAMPIRYWEQFVDHQGSPERTPKYTRYDGQLGLPLDLPPEEASNERLP